MRGRRYGENSRLRSSSSPRRRLSPPSVRFRVRDYSPPRRYDSMNREEERRGGSYSRRDCDRRYEHGDTDYRRNYDLRDKDYERRSRDRLDCGDRRHGKSFNYGEARISNFNGMDRDIYRDGDTYAGDGYSQGMHKSNIYQSTGRAFKYGDGPSPTKFQCDHLFYESKKSDGFNGSIHQGIGSSGLGTGLDYGYQRSKYLDEGRAGHPPDGRTSSLDAERRRDFSPYQMDLHVLPKSSSQVDAVGGFISNSSLCKDEGLHFHDYFDKFADRLLLGAKEANPLPYSKADIDFVSSPSRSKAFDDIRGGIVKEDVPGSFIPSDGVKFSSDMSTNYFVYGDYGTKSQTRSPVDCRGRLSEFKSYSRPYVDTVEERSSNFSYPVVGRGKRSATVANPLESHGNMEDIGEHFGHQDVSKVGMLDTNNNNLDGSSHQEYLSGNRSWDPPPTSLGQSTSSYYDAHELSNANRQDLHDQDFGSPRILCQGEFYHSHGSSLLEQHHGYGVAGSSRSPKKRVDRFSPREYDPSLGSIDAQPQKELLLDDIRISRASKKMSRQRYDTKMQSNEYSDMVYDIGGAGASWTDDMDSNILSEKMEFTSKNGNMRKIPSFMAHRRPSSPIPVSFCTRDIKDRLGPSPKRAHVSQRLSQKFKPSIKKRLGSVPQKNYSSVPPWVKNLKAPKLPRRGNASDQSHFDQGEEHQEATISLAKPEPPENSEEFRQMVISAFFKFVKQLNETPAKRKKYKEQGKAGSLKCIVCGSSEEFEDTESLATHAFTSPKYGLRSQHLGFHRAICALMGWKSAEAIDSVWICETLSHAETSCIKEDLILWPPAVIVHNSTITNPNPDQRVVISLEKLEARLRDLGFGYKMKVLRGKPANQSIMIVQFGGTLSGLLEAERLHNMYAETKHGKAVFQQVISFKSGSYRGETKDALVSDKENILYGYLGTAEDLDKLDFDMKKRCVVKSKKDIQNIAEAPLVRP